MVEAGKLERALDLVGRLHLEKSFDIAITMADRLNHRSLSDRIEQAKERWLSLQFPDQPEDVEDDVMGMEEMEDEHEEFDYDDNSATEPTRDIRRDGKASRSTENPTSGPVRRISPDLHRTTKKRSFEQVADEKKPKNPFAKKRLASPAHASNLVAWPMGLSSPKPKISRSSTFSTKSREQTKASKNIL
jgi:chromosome transmission fidelity protein 4